MANPTSEEAPPTTDVWGAWTRGLKTTSPVDGNGEPPRATAATDLRLPLQGSTPETLAEGCGAALSSVRKVVAAVQQRGLAELEGHGLPIPRRDREAVAGKFRVGRLRVVERLVSQVDPFIKYLFEAEDGARFEAVRIPLLQTGRFSVCVSSQVGCGLGCRFCATGRMGLLRNLAAWEIVEQVRQIRQELPANTRVHGVVFQGMGDPLANLDQVLKAVDVLSHPCGQCVDQRSITLCTAGIPAAIRRLAHSNSRVRLGISVGSARPALRQQLMPIERPQPLTEVLAAAAEHSQRTGYAPMLAVTLLAGVNCAKEDALALRDCALEFHARTGILPRLSLITYNSLGEQDPFQAASAEELENFRQVLSDAGLPVVRRYSGGADVGAACGQLVARTAT